MNLFKAVGILTISLSSLYAEKVASTNLLTNADRQTLNALFAHPVTGGEMLRDIVLNGTTNRSLNVGGQNLSFNCRDRKQKDYCNQVVGYICSRAMELREEAVEKNGGAMKALSDTILNGLLMSHEILGDEVYRLADGALRTPPNPGGPRLADTWAPMTQQLKNQLRYRDIATHDMKGALAGDVAAIQTAWGDRLAAQFAEANEIVIVPPAAEQIRTATERLEDLKEVLQADLMQAYGRMPKVEVAVGMDGKVYVAFDITLNSGQTGQVIAELTPRGLPPYAAGPTLIPIAMRPEIPVRVSVDSFTPAMACTLGARSRGPLVPFEVRAKMVEMPGQDPFVAFDFPMHNKFLEQTLIPSDRRNPSAPFYIAEGPRLEERVHPASLVAPPEAEKGGKINLNEKGAVRMAVQPARARRNGTPAATH